VGIVLNEPLRQEKNRCYSTNDADDDDDDALFRNELRRLRGVD
jgi:hypothetical protein